MVKARDRSPRQKKRGSPKSGGKRKKAAGYERVCHTYLMLPLDLHFCIFDVVGYQYAFVGPAAIPSKINLAAQVKRLLSLHHRHRRERPAPAPMVRRHVGLTTSATS